ncbi:MAG: hydrogen peroxide-inducible gene activator [Pseudolabrys sp.]|jgi:LysR family hydrogen peroxide-inducible transcriptional activator|nr:hydrogen peroxide-inducible gene activator [Pseudolabrys sp.]
MITLRQLRYLASLARHRHFGRAADDCAVTQPALSMQIREFERELGVELIERRPNDIALTETGLEVAARAEHILASVRDLVDFARHRDPLSGSLKLGIIPTLAPYLLPRVLPPLQLHYPALALEIRESQTSTLVDELVTGRLDAAMLALPVEGADLDTVALFNDAFLLAVPANDPLHGPITPDDVDRRRLILLEEGHCLRDQALAFCGMARRDLPAGLGATSLTTVMQMVANGFGVTLVPQIAADTELCDRRVRVLRFAAPAPGRTIGLAWRKTSPRRADFEALGGLVQDLIVPALSRHRDTAGAQ